MIMVKFCVLFCHGPIVRLAGLQNETSNKILSWKMAFYGHQILNLWNEFQTRIIKKPSNPILNYLLTASWANRLKAEDNSKIYKV